MAIHAGVHEQSDARRYSLEASRHSHGLDELLDEYPFPVEAQFGCYRLSGENRFSDIARRVECDVFEEFFGNAAAVMAQQYGPYEQSSDFLLIVDRKDVRALGALRTIRYSDVGFKTLNDIALPPLSIPTEEARLHCQIDDWSRCWDIATVAVIPECRGDSTGRFVSLSLYGHGYALAMQHGVQHFVAILDAHAYRLLTKTFAIPFAPILESSTFNYLGSECSCAAHVRVADIRSSMENQLRSFDKATRAMLSPHFRRLLDGEGLPPLVEVDG